MPRQVYLQVPEPMPMKSRILLIAVLLLPGLIRAQQLIDAAASEETKSLFNALRAIPGKGVMFGHQDGDAYGVGWRKGKGTPDVFAVEIGRAHV